MSKGKLSDDADYGDDSMEGAMERRHYLTNANGKYLHEIDLGTFIAPRYALCNTCPFAPKNGGKCEEFMEDADCSIERTFFDVLIQSLAEHDVDDMDRLVVFPLAQKLFRLNRLYALESEIDLRDVYYFNNNDKNTTMELYVAILKLVSDQEKGYAQLLKELRATRKERTTGKQKPKENSLQSIFNKFDV